jgi:hypothetical protein
MGAWPCCVFRASGKPNSSARAAELPHSKLQPMPAPPRFGLRGGIRLAVQWCGVVRVRRDIYLLLVVFLVQLSGLRALCVPSARHAHPCCPMSGRPGSSSLPDCCISSLLTCQGSITETRNVDRPSEYTAHAATAPPATGVPVVAVSIPTLQRVLPSISPPLSPLSQSCLLLI